MLSELKTLFQCQKDPKNGENTARHGGKCGTNATVGANNGFGTCVLLIVENMKNYESTDE